MAPRTPNEPLIIGLTGPIGCGKSTVARMLAELGGTVVDADQLARELTAPGEPTLPAIRERFGDRVFAADGSLDRQAMADVVFSDADALAALEAIVHPAVRRRIEAELAAAGDSGAPFVAIEAIKLIEGGLADRCDTVWLIECSPDAQRRHLLARGTDPDDADRRIRAQGDGLADRLAAQLEGRPWQRVWTGDSLRGTRERVENALADLLAGIS